MSRLPVSPTPADPLGEALHALRLTGTLYCRAELTAPWAIAMPAFDGLMTFLVVTTGDCWLDLGGVRRRLGPGSLTLVPHETAYVVRSDPCVAPRPLFEIPVERITDRYEIMRFGGGGELTQVTCGVVRFEHATARRLIASLPDLVHVDSWDDPGGWLTSTLQLIAREASALRPGGDTVLTRLADVLVIQAIRAWLESSPESEQGWLGALRDEHVGRALATMHRAPGKAWTLARLAKEVGMSRSAFAERFTELVGEPAITYLTSWRMQLAWEALETTTDSVAEIAERLGYRSDAAFVRAFRRTHGITPGAVRRPDGRPSGRAHPRRPWGD